MAASLSLDFAIVTRPVYGASSDTEMEKNAGYGDSHSSQFAREIPMHKGARMHFKVGSSLEVMGRLKSWDQDSIASLLQENVFLVEGELLHSHVVKTGLDGDKFCANLLVSMYGRFGLVEESCCVFDNMPERSLVSWSAIISACTQHGHAQKAMTLFQRMCQAGLVPNHITFVTLLTACATLCALEDGRSLHVLLVEHGIDIDTVLGTSLLCMYGKCWDLDAARHVFHNMQTHDTVAWNAMIATFQQHDDSSGAGNLFVLMQEKGIQPDKSTFVSVLAAYASTGQIDGGRFAHRCIVKLGLDSLLEVANALVHMYGVCGAAEDARYVFCHICHADVVSWNSMIAACAQEGQKGSFREAFDIFMQMLDAHVQPTRATFLNMLSACTAPEALSVGKHIHAFISESRGEIDMLVATALVDMYGNCGAVEEAEGVFDEVERPDVICWNSMITCYSQQGQGTKALLLFQKMMQRGPQPDKITFSSILSACSDLRALLEGTLIYACIVDYGFDSDIVIVHALIHMYGKCGKLDEALTLFNRLKPKGLISWNAMISAYSQQGHGMQAIELYRQMLQEGVRPDEVTFVSLLSACSHAGLIYEGCDYFVLMSEVYELTPFLEHYVCLIDLFARAGWLEEAEDLIRVMPYQATIAMWSAMLTGCIFHKDLDRAKHAAGKLFELEPGAETSYVLLSNLSCTEDGWEQAMLGRRVFKEGSQLHSND